MKKIISKVLIILIVFLLLFDFVFASQYSCVYAAIGPSKGFVDGVSNLAGGIVAIIYTLLKALIVGLTYGVQVLTTVTASAYGVNNNDGFWKNALNTVIDPITPIDIFFNKYKVLDINFFDFEGLETDSFIYLFRMSIAEWYAIMKIIACSVLLVILIYVGVRMAMSTIADDKAKYKKMFADWVVSLVLIFVLQYIIIFTINCNTVIVNALETAFGDSKMSSLASQSVLNIGVQGIIGAGITSFASVLVYIMIVFQTIIFLLAYMKRMVKIGFLIMISPLISITYSIDKIKDGKAQALGNWLKEFVYTILIQPFHCIIYLALVQTAIELLKGGEALEVFDIALFNSLEYNQLAAGVLAIMCLKFVNDGEKIVRKIFGFKDDGSTGMGAGAALGMAAIMNAKKIGGATRKGVNNFKNKYGKYGTAVKNDVSKLFQHHNVTRLEKLEGQKKLGGEKGKKASEKLNKFNEKAQNKADKKTNKQEKRTLKSTAKQEKRQKFKDNHKYLSAMGEKMKRKASLSTALGIMGAAMVYSSGDTSALSAVATGTALQKGTQEFFGSSNKTMEEDDEDNHEALEDAARKEQIEDKINATGDGFSQNAVKAINAYKELDELTAKRDKEKDTAPKEELDELDKKIADRKDIIKKYDVGGNLAGKEENGKMVRYTENDFDAWQKNANEKFEDERESRFMARTNPPSTKELDDVKNKIIAQLRAAKKAQKSPTNLTQTLTIDEEADISATAQILIDKISLGVLNKNGFGQEQQKKLVADRLGLNRDGDNFLYEGTNDFFKYTSQYENYARQNAIAQNYSHVANYDETGNGIATSSLHRRELKNYEKKHKK